MYKRHGNKKDRLRIEVSKYYLMTIIFRTNFFNNLQIKIYKLKFSNSKIFNSNFVNYIYKPV